MEVRLESGGETWEVGISQVGTLGESVGQWKQLYWEMTQRVLTLMRDLEQVRWFLHSHVHPEFRAQAIEFWRNRVASRRQRVQAELLTQGIGQTQVKRRRGRPPKKRD